MPFTFMWDGPIAIFDEVTLSGAGEIELTLAGFNAWKVIRTAGLRPCPVPDHLVPGVLLSGPAGAGKTQRARELLAASGGRPMVVAVTFKPCWPC